MNAVDDVAHPRRLSAGATLQTWSFDAVERGRLLRPLILRRSPGGLRSAESLSLDDEAALIRALDGSGVPVPHVVHVLTPEDRLGDGFVMTRIEGETIPRKILRDAQFAGVRLLRDTLMPRLPADLVFQARVAANAIDLVAREITYGSDAERDARARMQALLGHDGSLPELESELAQRIRAGEFDLSDAAFAEHLWQSTLAKMAIDQPNYASYRREMQFRADTEQT